MDTIIRNARVVDGTRAGAYEADVGIVGGFITAVGCKARSDNGDEIDA